MGSSMALELSLKMCSTMAMSIGSRRGALSEGALVCVSECHARREGDGELVPAEIQCRLRKGLDGAQ